MLFARLLRPRTRSSSAPTRPPARRLVLEPLEDRTVPSTLTVLNTDDSGAGSLRQAILDAAPGDTVAFAANVTGTIALSDYLTVDKPLTITGPGRDRLTLSGRNVVRDIDVAPTAGNVTISGLTVANASGGRALSNEGWSYSSPTVTVTDCNFVGNLDGAIVNTSQLMVSNCNFVGNSSFDQPGGAIATVGKLTVNNCLFSGNSSKAGGAIFIWGTEQVGDPSTTTVTNSTFSNNHAWFWGGAISHDDYFGVLTVSNSTITDNTAGGDVPGYPATGGGIAVLSTYPVTLTVSNSTIARNSATGACGGIDDTNWGQLRVVNTIVALNDAPYFPDISSNSNGSLSAVVIGKIDGFTGSVSGLYGTAANPLDPLLGPLEDNGGPTPTMAPLFGSPALDAGDDTNGGVPVPGTDQRGRTRIAGAAIDIGAYETQPSVLQPEVADVWTGASTSPITRQVAQETIGGYLTAVADITPHPAASQPAQIVFDLGGGTVTGQTVRVPAGVTLTFTNGTFVGGSPALTLIHGTLAVHNSTLTNATDAPTILVTGGDLTLRNDVVQESTGYSQVAILVEGGTLDLGSPSDSGGNTLNVNGAGELLLNPGGFPVTMYGDTWQVNGTTLAGGIVHPGEAAGIGFWAGPNGRNLINTLGTDKKGVSLAGKWLAATYPNLYGSLSRSTPDGVWSYFVSLFNAGGIKLEAQVMATALSAFVTDTTLNTTSIGRATALKYGFTGGSSLGSESVYADADQAADLGLTGGGGYYTVSKLLSAADALASKGLLFALATDWTKRSAVNDLFAYINDSGDVATP
jgi:hypothetical protein